MEIFGILSMFSADRDKQDDIGFYSLFSTICSLCSRNDVVYVGVYQNW